MRKEKNSLYKELLSESPPLILPRPRMRRQNRAAQFAPFDALTGYGEELCEARRLTEEDRILSEDQQQDLDRCMADALRQEDKPVTVWWFEKDRRKSGGVLRKISGTIRQSEPDLGRFQMDNGIWIRYSQVRAIESRREHRE